MVSLSIIIPAKNEEKFLPLLIKSLRRQSYKDFEIIVADANSTDRTRKITGRLGCKVVQGGPPDIGRNSGAKHASASLLCFVDSDVIIKNKLFLEKAIREFYARKLDIAGTLQEPIKTGKKSNDFLFNVFYGISNNAMLGAENSKSPLMQNVMFASSEVFRKVKGFPPYIFGEDSGLAVNAVRKGYRFGILKKPGKVLLSPRRFLGKNGTKMNIFSLAIKLAYFNTLRFFGHEFIRGKSKIKYW